MQFYSTDLNLAKFLSEDTPTVEKEETAPQKWVAFIVWSYNNFMCKSYILNCLDNTLLNIYNSVKTPKLLWESMEKKYKIEDTRLKKFLEGKFMDFDSKTVMNQYKSSCMRYMQNVWSSMSCFKSLRLSKNYQQCEKILRIT